eukprot:7650295-Pyramimonas_sp.AAC.1
MRVLGNAALAHRMPFCIGGDWNNPPQAINDALPLHILDGIVRGDEFAPPHACLRTMRPLSTST